MRDPSVTVTQVAKGPTRKGAGLSAKLLVLTILFVMLAEVLIFVPSIANFRNTWLLDRLSDAELAVAAINPTTYQGPTDTDVTMQQVLLETLEAYELALNSPTQRLVLAQTGSISGGVMVERAVNVDVSDLRPISSIIAAFETLLNGDRILRIHGDADGHGGRYVDVVIEERYLRDALGSYSGNIVILSIVISLITAVLVYWSLNTLFVKPLRRLDEAMAVFADAPEDPASMIVPSSRRDELGTAEQRLASMQSDVRMMLTERKRLADVGLAVSKINHDLRNLLSSAHLLSERLDMIADPHVQRIAPKIVRAIDRAVSFAEATLAYGQVREEAPERSTFALAQLVDEAAEFAGLAGHPTVGFKNAIDSAMAVRVGRENLFRILLNLMRNGRHALEATSDDGSRHALKVDAALDGKTLVLTVADTGPGIPEDVRDQLFEPFHGQTGRRGSTGLGLAIAKELAEADGGTIHLDPSPAEPPFTGATFDIRLPDASVDKAP